MVLGKVHKDQLLNMLLRLLPLAAKFVLTLYMGRFFSLSELGVYGLVYGAVIIINTLMGQDFAYVVVRDIVHVPPRTALHKMRDQALYYSANYLLLIVAGIIAATYGMAGLSPKIIAFVVLLTILESYATFLQANMNSLNQQLGANVMVFIRSGIWVAPAVVMGLMNPAWRNVDVVLVAWMAGTGCSILGTLWFWRSMPWRDVMAMPVDWPWIQRGLKKSSLMWCGALGLNGGTFVDRFFVDHFLSLDDVGVLTFYFSFATALLTLMQSGVLAFAYPRLIAMHRDGNTASFLHEARQALWQVALGGGLMAVVMGIVVPLLGILTERPAFLTSAVTLWLMLAGTWLRANAETLNYVLYARHQDRALWLGNLLFLLPAIGGNALLVPLIGLPGIGCASILAAGFLLLWRWRHVGSLLSPAS